MHWTIIGGGIQGTTVAIKLRNEGISSNQLTIIDPYPSLCEQFNEYTKRISMPFLRSPFVHHIHPQPFHLKQYAKLNQYTSAYYGPYKRPQRDMFMHHIHDLVHQYDLNNSHIQGIASKITSHNKGKWQIELHNGKYVDTDCVVIANGCNHQPFIPSLFIDKPRVTHIFDKNYDQTIEEKANHIVGSGISAAHLTLKLIHRQNNHNKLHLWLNKNIEIHDFDADPGWLGPKRMNHLLAMPSPEARLKVINKERHKGSMPMELFLRLKKQEQADRLIIHHSPIDEISDDKITSEGCHYDYHHILLATGFHNKVCNQPMIKHLVLDEHAPLNSCGYPSLSDELEWLPQLFVVGALADLELGPFARNIMGGKEGAERISKALHRLNKKIS
ncbi:FAD/NAD(P)-binding protein [Staphylococcus capitis]|uniref:FAD/NAD(P)-binding protein n=1 Tax=Staphylococcus TaxID=1279 RepID=UPI0010F81C2D|nr:FAD/NAD(P)-binding protein [Staphylococcus sp. U]